ncbi:MAG: hypothetical protein J6T14_07705, partial [Clostridia bacterium]|nr:hypothetical protein [Clostridia bacterium]
MSMYIAPERGLVHGFFGDLLSPKGVDRPNVHVHQPKSRTCAWTFSNSEPKTPSKQTSSFAQTREKPYNSGKESKWKT